MPVRLLHLDSLDHPLATPYRNQKDAFLRWRQDPTGTGLPGGLFIAEGELVVRALIDSGRPIRSILATPERLERVGDALGRLPGSVPVLVAQRPLMGDIVGFHVHTGILAAGERGPEPALEDLLARARLLVLLEDLCNHDNVGGIFRNVSALAGPGAAVVLSPRCCDPLYRKALRVSMGHVLRVPHARAGDWHAALAAVANAGFTLAALTPRQPAIDIHRLHPVPLRLALLVGTEGAGLGSHSLAAASLRLRIPMSPGVDSLNATVAAGIALHHLTRTIGE